MSFNGSGTFVLNSGGLPYVTGTTISSTHANNLNSDLASGLSTCITKDGQTTVTANLPMSTFRHTNVGVAAARTDYARASQVQDSSIELIGSVAGTNTITGSLAPAITAYAVGQTFRGIAANTNTGAATLNINSVGAGAIQIAGSALVGGEIVANTTFTVMVTDAATPIFQLIGNGLPVPVRIQAASATLRTWSAANYNISPGKHPTRQTLTSGSGATYTTPAGCIRLFIRMVGGGGDGDGSDGNDTSFNSIVADHGNGGGGPTGSTNIGVAGGAGGSGGAGSASLRISGQAGSYGTPFNANFNVGMGGNGGNSVFGGAGIGNANGGGGGTAATNSGSGGGGDGATGVGNSGGGGGGAGEYVELQIDNPSATYTYTVGAAVGKGAAGIIIVDEFYC